MPKKLEPNKSRFETVFINRDKKSELIKERKRKRDESCKQEHKLGREMKNMKTDVREIPYKVPQFFENDPNMQFQSS